MYDSHERSHSVDFVSIRRKEGKHVLYVGSKGNLYSNFIPVTSIKDYFIHTPYQFFAKKYIACSVIDNDKRAHVFVNHFDENKNELKLIKHFVFDDNRYKRSFINLPFFDGTTRELCCVFTGEDEGGNLYIKVARGWDSFENLHNFVDENVIHDVQKGSVRLLTTVDDINDTRRLQRIFLLFLDKKNKPKILSMANREVLNIKASEYCKASITSSSEHIQFYGIPNEFLFVGDDGIYFFDAQAIFHTAFAVLEPIKLLREFPSEVKPKDINKVIVKKVSNIGNIESNLAFLLLTKEGELWVDGLNSYGILGDYYSNSGWEKIHDNIDDIYHIDMNTRGILIKTKEEEVFYRGSDDRNDEYTTGFPFIDKETIKVAIGMESTSYLVAKNIKSYVGTTKYIENGITHWYNYFLDNNGYYLKSYTNSSGKSNDKMITWFGDIEKMEDVLYESLAKPYFLMKYTCHNKLSHLKQS